MDIGILQGRPISTGSENYNTMDIHIYSIPETHRR